MLPIILATASSGGNCFNKLFPHRGQNRISLEIVAPQLLQYIVEPPLPPNDPRFSRAAKQAERRRLKAQVGRRSDT